MASSPSIDVSVYNAYLWFGSLSFCIVYLNDQYLISKCCRIACWMLKSVRFINKYETRASTHDGTKAILAPTWHGRLMLHLKFLSRATTIFFCHLHPPLLALYISALRNVYLHRKHDMSLAESSFLLLFNNRDARESATSPNNNHNEWPTNRAQVELPCNNNIEWDEETRRADKTTLEIGRVIAYVVSEGPSVD